MSNNLSNLFTDIADAIRNKSNDSGTIQPNNFPARISELTVEDTRQVEILIVNHTSQDINFYDGHGNYNKIGNGSYYFYEKLNTMVGFFVYYGNSITIQPSDGIYGVATVQNWASTYEEYLYMYSVGQEGSFCKFDIEYL